MVGHVVAEVAPVGDHREREVAVGDEADRPVAVHQHDRADVALPHQLGDLAHRALRRCGDDGLGHDFADEHGRASLQSRAVAHRTPTQRALQRRLEGLIGLAAPALDLLLFAGERVARVAGRNEISPDPPRRLGRREARTPIGGPAGAD